MAMQFAGPQDKRQPARPVFAGTPEVGGIWTKAGSLLGGINEALGTAQSISQLAGGSPAQPARGDTGGASLSDQVRSTPEAPAQPVMGGDAPMGGAPAPDAGQPNATGAYNPYAGSQFGAGGSPSGAGGAAPAMSSFAEGPVNLKPGEQGGPSTLQQLGQLVGTVAKMASAGG